MSGDGMMEEIWRYSVWAGVIAFGCGLAVVEGMLWRRRLLWILLVLLAGGGYLTTWLSPFTFSGGDYFILGVIVFAGALMVLAGYVAAAVVMFGLNRIKARSGA